LKFIEARAGALEDNVHHAIREEIGGSGGTIARDRIAGHIVSPTEWTNVIVSS
jgi:hypothetical protein